MREYTRGHVHMQVGDENYRAAFPCYPEILAHHAILP